MAETLDDTAVAERLRGLPAWARDGDAIRRQVKAPSFLAGIDVVTDVARAAEDADHHPDIDIRYTKITCSLSTHSEGGITEKDLAMAGAIEAVKGKG